MSTNVDLFSTPVKSGKIRNGVYYHKYKNGNINIMGTIYSMCSIKYAIKHWRKNNPK